MIGVVVGAEILKLRHSLILLLALAAPAFVGLFTFLRLVREAHAPPWSAVVVGASAVWAYFMLPMSITALAVLVAQIEHGPRSWDHIHTLPMARWKFYTGKIIAVVLTVSMMSALLFACTWVGAGAAGLLKPAVMPSGAFDAASFGSLLARMQCAGLLVVAIQLWLALRFANFAIPLTVGIGGTFCGVVAASWEFGRYVPWLMPINMLATQHEARVAALLVGSVGGCLVFLLQAAHLSRRDVV